MQAQVERRRFSFKRQVLSPELCYLLRDGKINATDLLVLFVIDSLVIAKGTNEGEDPEGCWASDQYIADAVDIHVVNASKTIRKLVDMGMVIRFRYQGRRYLETEWARGARGRAALTCGYGKALRKASKDAPNWYEMLSENASPAPSENASPAPSENARQTIKKKKEVIQRETVAAGAGDGAKKPTSKKPACSNASNQNRLEGFFKSNKPTWATSLAEEFRSGLLKAGKVFRIGKNFRRYNRDSWAEEFDGLVIDLAEMDSGDLKKARKLVDEVLHDHLAHIEEKYQPQAYSAKRFREKFNEIVGARRRRQDQETDGNGRSAAWHEARWESMC